MLCNSYSLQDTRSSLRLKPIITVYAKGRPDQTKKFDGFIQAAFWIGVDHAEGDLESVKVRQPDESYDADVANLLEFTNLMVQRQISFSVEFFAEPPSDQEPRAEPPEPRAPEETSPATTDRAFDYANDLVKLKDDFQRGAITRKQYESRKSLLLKRWKDDVEGGLRE